MSPADLIERLMSSGCRLRPDGAQLRIEDPEYALTDALRAAIRQHKQELLKLLRSEPANDTPAPCPTCGDPERWPTDKGPVCIACFIDSITPEPAPAYVKRCEQCGGVNWGPSGGTLGGAEVWHCLRCNPEEQAHE
jgi:hypothetical protein